ncbi:EthD domain-containing protein [Pestalotiopsis sp. NC0098]|nr:EthD domain-containing protein [Pestalotiopsis sp. NC0098]
MSVAFLKRRPDLTPEQFYTHWETVHGPLVKPWAQKHGIVGYTQVHCQPALNAGAAPIGPEANAVSPLADFDGCALFEVKSFEQMANAFKDEYYLTVIAGDEKNFIDKKAGVVRSRGEVKRIL